MKLFPFVIVFFIFFDSPVVLSQYDVFSRNGRFGIQTKDGAQVVRAKFDCIQTITGAVSGVLKKRGWGYYDLESKKYILRPKYDSITTFKNGVGFYFSSGRWYSITPDKKALFHHTLLSRPYVVGKYIIVPREGLLFSLNGKLLSRNIRRVDLYNRGALIETSVEKEKVEKRLLFFKKRTRYNETHFFLIEDQVEEKIKPLEKLIRDSLFTYGVKEDSTFVLIDNRNTIITQNANSFTVIDDHCFFYREGAEAYLVSNSSRTKVPYQEYVVSDSFDLGLYSDGSADLLKKENRSVISAFKNFYRLVNNELVMVKNDAEYDLLNTQGDTLIKNFTDVLPKKDGYYEVRRGPFYRILDPNDKKAFGKRFVPVYYGTDHYVRRYGLLKLQSEKKERYGKVSFFGEVTENKFAVVAVPLTSEPVDTLRKDDFEVRYNYLKRDGTLLNSKKYRKCLPFMNGKGFVKVDKHKFFLVDEEGNEIDSKIYEDVTYIREKGIFIVEVGVFKKGIMNDRYEWVYPPVYVHFQTKDGMMYGRKKGGEEDVITL